MENNLLSEQEAAKFLGQSHRTLQQWRWCHKGPDYVKIGRSVRYRQSDLEEYVERNSVNISDE